MLNNLILLRMTEKSKHTFMLNNLILLRIIEKSKHTIILNNFSPKSCHNVQPDRPQMTIRGMRIACWIPKATNTQNMEFLLFFHCNSGYRKAFQYYVTRTLAGFF